MNASTPQPVCFMVMPYGTKPTNALPGGLAEINFDALWDCALRPAIVELGYEPVRADQDIGTLIIHEMLERLYFSDLVIAEMTIPNGNVYYEVGVRHACRDSGCVLLAADWSKPLFDVAQMRLIRYPITQSTIDDAGAKAIKAAISDGISKLAAGSSPICEVLPGYPSKIDPTRARSMRTQLDALAAFQGRLSSVRNAPRDERLGLAAKLMQDCCARPPVTPAVAHGLLKLFENLGAWQLVLDLTSRLPAQISQQSSVTELANLAKSKLGNQLEAIGALDSLIKTAGPTSEREGLLGGRYKQLWTDATNPKDKRRYLNEAIKHYEQGMMLDLNDYYPSGNLSRLYRARGASGDAEKAIAAAHVVYFACQRAKERNAADEFLRPTLLGAAFDAGDVDEAQGLFDEIAATDIDPWKLDTTIPDLELSLQHVTDQVRRSALQTIVDQLKLLG